jgi:hypothetical protein
MADFVFTSPGVKFKERDLTYVTRNVGITTLGLAGETLKGPAFEPIFIQDQTQFMNRFGAQSVKRFPSGNLQYQLPYVANAFLGEAQQLWVTRVLGLSGYQAGTAWNITLDAGVDTSTAVLTASATTTGNTFTGGTYLGVALGSSGATGSLESGYTKNGSVFTQIVHQFTATTYNAGSGSTTDMTTTYTATSYTEYENMVLAVIRSRADSNTAVDGVPVTDFLTSELNITGNTTSGTVNPTGDIFDSFTLSAVNPITNTGSAYSGTSAIYKVSLNPNDASYLPNVIGNEPKNKNTMIWVQAIYPDLIKKLDADGIAYAVNTEMITGSTSVFTDYEVGFQTPETPWVVSQLKGNNVDRLFKFISISDGDAANQEIKITIGNIDPYTGEFDIAIRSFYDTDANPVVLETFTKCTLIKGQSNYIGQRIGTSDGEYTLISKYIMVEIAEDLSPDVFPAGFEGFMFNNYTEAVTDDTVTEGIPPKIFYKTSYADTDKVSKTYLGISELAYTGDGINQNMFNFDNWYSGQPSSGFTKSNGFHMDSGATGATISSTGVVEYFEVGAGDFGSYQQVENPLNPYYDPKKRKFTVVPAGGFDGWDVNRRERSYDDDYRQGGRRSGFPGEPLVVPTNDFQAWEMAIDTFANPESITINLFATPGINWAEQTTLVQNTIDMIEQQRTDTLYVIDSPQGIIDFVSTVGDSGKADVNAVTEISNLLGDTEIDSSYSCTYYPWIQMRDTQNNVNIYIPATGEVVKAMAFTDNISFPWFAPAGLNRGVTNARKSQYKLSLEARDILYAGRINPMADFADAGTAIFGQKTLQVKESALDRINVRRLLLQIKVLIANIAIRLVFEQDDQVTIDQFLNKANPILDSIKRERGLSDFRIKMDDSNNTPETRDRNELYGELFLKPTRAVEFIGITFTITPSGASFADVGA